MFELLKTDNTKKKTVLCLMCVRLQIARSKIILTGHPTAPNQPNCNLNVGAR